MSARSQQRQLAELLRIGVDWTWHVDPRGRITWLSPEFEARTGQRIADFLRVDEPGGAQLIHNADWDAQVEALRARRAFRHMPIGYRCPDGHELHVLASGEPMLDADGSFLGWWGASRDVTREVLAARESQRSRELLDRLFANSPDPICVARIDNGAILMANPAFVSFAGRPEHEVIGRSGRQLEFWAERDTDLRLREAQEAAGGVLRDWPTRARRADGSVRDVLVNFAAFVWDGAPVGVHSVRDVTEQRRTEVELLGARAQADGANQAKSAFLATMSHEIRTPLNAVLGLARLLQDERDERRRRDYQQHLLGAAEGLAGLVSDVLDLSKIEAGRVALEDIEFDLHELVRSSFQTFAPLGRERGLAMECRVAPGLPRMVRGDPVRVRQIVSNYLNNGLKFTTRGRIAVEADVAADGAVRIEVHDSGMGIAPAARERLFMPFSQADSSTTRRFGGTGLGLSICRELAVLMGGRVGVASRLGEGSVFWVELPLRAAAGTGVEPASSAAAAVLPLAGLKLLVAEDNPVNLLIVRTVLERLGARVIEAVDGRDAVAAAGESLPDAVLMDLHMPVMDGLEATRELRSGRLTTAIPVFALSAAVLEQDRADARDAGVQDFLPKPVSEADLLRVLGPIAARRASTAGN